MRTFTKLKCLGAILLSIMLLTPVGSQVFAQQILSYHKADQQKSLTSNRRTQEISLTHILKQLEAKHQVHLNYDWNSLKGKTLNIRLKLSDNLSKDLNAILPKFDLTYKKVKKNYYVIFPSNEAKSSWKEGKRSKTSREIPKIPNKKLDNLDQTNLNQNSLNNYQKEIVRIIQGVVQDDEGEPLPGVNIVVKGTSIGTLTDVNGAYNINVPEGDNQILIFSFVGYKAQEIAVNNQTSINVKMEADVAIMDEVVVIGYGTQQKRDLVSSVAKVEGKDLENVPNSRVDQILQGRATGVLVTQTSGEPGAATTIRVRGGNSIQGDNEPLWVIDGIIVGTDFNLNNLNSNDIKSIEILKDATAISIYGTRGANGVILVTTKSGVGVSPGKPQVSANFYAGVQDVIAIPEFLDGPEFAAYANEDAEFRNATLPFQDLDAVPNVDWFDLVTQSAPIYNADISVSGSSEDGGLNYYVSGNYFNQEGTVRGSGIEKYIFRTNLDFKLSSKIKAGLRLNVARLIRENNKVNVDGLFGSLLPVRAVRDENGDFTAENPVSASIQTNAIADIELRHNQRTITNILASAYLEYKPIKQLTIRSSFSPTLNYYKENRYNPGALPQNQQQQTGGDARIQSSMDQDWLNENTVTYSGKIGKDHKITVLGGVTAQKTTVEFAREDAGGIPYDVTTFNNLDVGSDPELYVSHSQFTGRSLVSVLGRINYSYKGRYLVTLVGRQDWSSVFAPGNKGEFFPSIGVAWIMSEEPFIQNLNVFDLLKLRASYGRAGSQAIGPYRTLAVLSRNNSSFNASEQSGLVLGRPENPNLFWETTQQLDLGLEASFFKGRLNVELDYYYKKTSDLLLNVQIPRQTGFNSRLQNLGEVENRGLELLISSTNISTADFSWNTSA